MRRNAGGGQAGQDEAEARDKLQTALDSGRAAEIFGRMVAALGGPADFMENYDSHMAPAPIVRPVLAERAGFVGGMDTRGIGMAVCALGGGRRLPSDELDFRVGLSRFVELGQRIDAGVPWLIFTRLTRTASPTRSAASRRRSSWLTRHLPRCRWSIRRFASSNPGAAI